MSAESQSTKFEIDSIPVSPSVHQVSQILGDREVSSLEIVSHILKMHDEYGYGKAEKLLGRSRPKKLEQKSFSGWLRDVYKLFDPQKVKEIHGRLLIIGLSEIDVQLKSYLAELKSVLIDELNETYEDLLRSESAGKEYPSERTVLNLDGPAEVDLLGRQGFAAAVAEWMSRLWLKNQQGGGNSFNLHLQGSWGAGKTTLLKLLEKELSRRKKNRWIVVWFNAWQYQQIRPVWWPLVDRIYKQSRRQLLRMLSIPRAIWLFIYETFWRLRTGNRFYFLLMAFFSLALGILIFYFVQKGKLSVFISQEEQISLKDQISIILSILALVGTLWTALQFILRSFFFGSADVAQSFQKVTQSPMTRLQAHFNSVLKRIKRPVVVLIDDLDRCDADYVVEVFECIQALYNHSRIFYIISADRRWLMTCLESKYPAFKRSINEPGRQMAHLFLEKIFQLNISLPPIPPEVKKAYLEYLVSNNKEDFLNALDEKRKLASQKLVAAKNDPQMIQTLHNSLEEIRKEGKRDLLQELSLREAAVVKSASEEFETATEHFLIPFWPLLDHNPRAIKRLVNAYGIQRALAILSDLSLINTDEKRQQLVLWTIIQLRWPLLSEFLEKNPDRVDEIREGSPPSESDSKKHFREQSADNQQGTEPLPGYLTELIQKSIVRDVLNCKVDKTFRTINPTPLDDKTIKQICGIIDEAKD